MNSSKEPSAAAPEAAAPSASGAAAGSPSVPPAEAPPLSQHELARRLIATYGLAAPVVCAPGHELPSPVAVRGVLTRLRGLLFPGLTESLRPIGASLQAQVEAQLAALRLELSQQVFRGLHHRCPAGADCAPCEERAARITDAFLGDLPELRVALVADAQAAYDGDPAATGADEVVFSYPGLLAVSVYRVAHRLLRLGAVIVPRMMTEQAHGDTGIDIHPGARIGASFFIDHGTGVVIGETTVIGDRVRVYQGVTLGALSLPTGKARVQQGHKRHPTIEDDVIIYANATILGGDTVIGRGAIIGGNTWVTRSVPPAARITGPCHT